MNNSLAKLAPFTRLSDRVWRVMGLNPGKFTLQGTNTYLVGTGPRKLLIDCGEGRPDYVTLLQTSLESISPEAYVSDIIITHGHHDHFGGLESILSAPINKNRNIRVHKFSTQNNKVDGLGHLHSFPPDIPVLPLQDQQIFQTDGATLKVIYTPGHCQDHCTFWLEEEQSLFTADCILGHGTAVFEDLSSYMAGLHCLLALNPIRLYPGHGEWIEPGVPKIREYIEHRQQRERQILDFLSDSSTCYTPLEIVKVLYKDYPTSLHLPAAHNILLHLLKLEKDGMATWDRSLETDSIQWKQTDLLQKTWHRL
ncbi:metallo-beta-lactamase [Chlamydoabsidia padenii]|nr:metallo-beta-lactamase [Chlamydoabsidia padenii]